MQSSPPTLPLPSWFEQSLGKVALAVGRDALGGAVREVELRKCSSDRNPFSADVARHRFFNDLNGWRRRPFPAQPGRGGGRERRITGRVQDLCWV